MIITCVNEYINSFEDSCIAASVDSRIKLMNFTLDEKSLHLIFCFYPFLVRIVWSWSHVLIFRIDHKGPFEKLKHGFKAIPPFS